MANNSNPAANPPTFNSNPTFTLPAKEGKKKAARKAAAPSGSTTQAAPVAPAAEILFKGIPNPYHPPQPPFIWIDFPEERERLRGPVYTIRLGVGGAQQVEISIDGGPWHPCRLTSGYWWFDWSGIRLGKHTLAARMRTFDGRTFRTPARACEYRP
jgi:hypothetical protein